PYWETELRDKTGLDNTVIDFLETDVAARELVNQIGSFLDHWLPHYDKESRSYLTVALGCTGGQHRSVYVAQRLVEYFQYRDAPVQITHRDLNVNSLLT
ncbi:MAG: RNase adapter RapZ, partial [Pseudomonadota bacterium]|nr:RNase adapter RapZ [Pseudomonadota bacterium]